MQITTKTTHFELYSRHLYNKGQIRVLSIRIASRLSIPTQCPQLASTYASTCKSYYSKPNCVHQTTFCSQQTFNPPLHFHGGVIPHIVELFLINNLCKNSLTSSLIPTSAIGSIYMQSCMDCRKKSVMSYTLLTAREANK